MSSHHLVDPELQSLLEVYLTDGVSAGNLAENRSSRAALVDAAPPPPDDGVRREDRTVPGRAGDPDVPLIVYTPPVPGPRPALLHIHGGGYVMGQAAASDLVNRGFALALGCTVVSVDYRLAPETTHPGPVEDCYAALTWLHDHADELGVDPARIGIKGESAGGGLAAALALVARDRGGPAVAVQVLIYPMIDDRTVTSDDPHPLTGEFVWDAGSNRFGWESLLGEAPGGPDVPAYAAASRALDLTGLPPTFLAVGALDLFLEEDLDYARRLTRAGVPVELHVYPGAYHAFYYAEDAAVTKRANRDITEALLRAL